MATMDGLPVVADNDGDEGGYGRRFAVEHGREGRVSNAPMVPSDEMRGSTGSIGEDYAVNLPTIGYRNPGPTENLRGVDVNTGKQNEGGNSYELPHQHGSMTQIDTVC